MPSCSLFTSSSKKMMIVGLLLTTVLFQLTACKKIAALSKLHNESAGRIFFVNPNSPAMNKFKEMQRAGDPNASLIQRVAYGTVSNWLASDNPNMTKDVGDYIAQAKAAGKVPVFVSYMTPNRDCDNYSKGGSSNFQAYYSWIDKVVAGIGSNTAWLIFEPDILPLPCNSGNLAQIKEAVYKFKRAPSLKVYIDIGHANWLAPEEAVRRLKAAGIEKADGFSVNVSNYVDINKNVEFGKKIAEQVNKNFVIDTSRNGKGSSGGTGIDSWCNVRDRALGKAPTTATGIEGVDAFIWIKNPGESDGDCTKGYPPPGVYFHEIALELSRNSDASADTVSAGALPAGTIVMSRSMDNGVMGSDGVLRECRGNQIFVNNTPDVICDKACSIVGELAKCKDDLGHWPNVEGGVLGPDGIVRECRGNQIFVNNNPDVICDKACFMAGQLAKCKDDLSHWPTTGGVAVGPDGISRECRGNQIFVNNNPDVICDKACFLVNYLAKCQDDLGHAPGTGGSTEPVPSSGSSEAGLTGMALLDSIKAIIGADGKISSSELETKPFMGSFANIKTKVDPNLAAAAYCMTDNHCGHMDAYSRSDVPLSDLSCNKFCYVDPNTKKYKPSSKYTIQNPPKYYLCCGWETCN